MAEKFVRFVVNDKEPVTGEVIGFFKAAYSLRRSELASVPDAAYLNELLAWFDSNLDAPNKFSKANRPHRHGKAISWFKPSALEHIAKSRELLELMLRYSIQSEMIVTSKPGIMVYEDEYQVAAIPFRSKDF